MFFPKIVICEKSLIFRELIIFGKVRHPHSIWLMESLMQESSLGLHGLQWPGKRAIIGSDRAEKGLIVLGRPASLGQSKSKQLIRFATTHKQLWYSVAFQSISISYKAASQRSLSTNITLINTSQTNSRICQHRRNTTNTEQTQACWWQCYLARFPLGNWWVTAIRLLLKAI